jgi:hypothetical protein
MNVYSKPLRGTRIEVSVPFATKQESPRIPDPNR